MRFGLRAERGPQSANQRCAFQFVWLRRDQWIADLQEVDGIRRFAADQRRLNADQSHAVQPMSRYRFKFETLFLVTILYGLSAPAQVSGQKWNAQWEPVKL